MFDILCYEIHRYDVCVDSHKGSKVYTFYKEDEALDFAYKAGDNLIYFERVERPVLERT